MRIRLICFGVLLCTAALAQPAAAQVQPAGTGEPQFTNSAQNTQWFEWPASSGADAYRVQFRYVANNAEVSSPTVPYGTGAGGAWANWSGVATLQHGGQYGGGPEGLCDNAKGFVYGYNPACSVPGSARKATPSPARPTTAPVRPPRRTARCGRACARPTRRSGQPVRRQPERLGREAP